MTVKTITKKSLSVKELSILYDRIYNIADRLIKKHNPCNIHTKTLPAKDAFYNPKLRNLLPEQLVEIISCTGKYINTLCCGGCKYWNKSCTVKSLGCKLFLCQYIKNKVLQKRFRKLRDYSTKHLNFDYCGIDGYKWNYSVAIKYYTSKEDWLKFMREHNAE